MEQAKEAPRMTFRGTPWRTLGVVAVITAVGLLWLALEWDSGAARVAQGREAPAAANSWPASLPLAGGPATPAFAPPSGAAVEKAVPPGASSDNVVALASGAAGVMAMPGSAWLLARRRRSTRQTAARAKHYRLYRVARGAFPF